MGKMYGTITLDIDYDCEDVEDGVLKLNNENINIYSLNIHTLHSTVKVNINNATVELGDYYEDEK